MRRTSFSFAATVVASALLVSAPAAAQISIVFAPPLPPPPPPPMFAELPPPELRPAAPPPKRQGFTVAGDMEALVPLDFKLAKTAGVGLDLRLGYRFAAGPLWIAPEATVGYLDFPQWEGAVRYGGGLRVGAHAGIVEPSIYGAGGGFWSVFKSGWGVRTGVALDLRPYRFLAPGIHADYNLAGWDTRGRVEYVGLGAHLGFVI